jgi:hypothetical protein
MNRLPARLHITQGGWTCELHSDQGRAVLPLSAVNDPSWDGREVLLGVRAEHFSEAGPVQTSTLPVTVQMIEPTGADTYGHTEINDRRVALRLPPKRLHSAGHVLHLSVDSAAARFFRCSHRAPHPALSVTVVCEQDGPACDADLSAYPSARYLSVPFGIGPRRLAFLELNA